MLTLILAIVPIEIALLYYTIRRSGLVLFPHLLLIYLIGCELSIYFVASGITNYSFLVTFSSYAFESHYVACQIFFATIFLSSFAIFLPPPNVGYVNKSFRWLAKSSAIKHPLAVQTLWTVIAILWVYHFLLFLSLNWSLVWSNEVYLLMGREGILTFDNPVTKLLISALSNVGLLIFVIMGFYRGRKGTYVVAALLPLGLFDFLYKLASHSRKAVLYIIIYAGLAYLIRRSRVTAAIGIVVAVLTLLFCLGGRTYGHHGFSSLLTPVAVISNYFKRDPSFAILNVFEGSFNTTELFNRTYTSSTQYKILSFLPLSSLVDGFDKIRDVQMHKLGPFSPPSAIFEAWSFGAPFVALFVITQIIAGRIVVTTLKKGNEFLAIAANALMAVTTYLEFTYPLRPVYRMVVIALLLGLIARRFAPRQHKPANVNVRTRRGPKGRRALASIVGKGTVRRRRPGGNPDPRPYPAR
jgi:hypothetical protein